MFVLRDLQIDPPLFNASGAFDVVASDPDWSQHPAAAGPLGAYVTKTVTAEARAGNPTPWVALWGGDESLVNSVGLANPGIDGALRDWQHLPGELGCPVVLSVGGSLEELVRIIELAEVSPWHCAYELNLSCPNTGQRSLPAADADLVALICRELRGRTEMPIIAKLSAACGDIGAIAAAAEAAGADAIAAINTMPVRPLRDDGDPLLGTLDGGLSGAALHPIALRCVAAVSDAVDIPVIGIGGVRSAASARRMLGCGASAVGVGTAAAIAPIVLAEVATALRSMSPV